MKSTVPPGTGARLRARSTSAACRQVGYVSNPEFLREGSAIRDFQHPDRVVVGAEQPEVGERIAALYRAFGGAELVTDVDLRRDDQARLQRVPRDQDLVHQRDRERVRGGRRERAIWSPAAWGWTRRIGSSFLRPGLGFGGSLLPEGRRRAQAAGRQQRLSLPAAERRDRGQRAAEAPRGREAQAPSGLAARPPHRALGSRLQARHRRHAGGLERRARGAPDRRGRRRRRGTTRSCPTARRPVSCRAASTWPRAHSRPRAVPTPSSS